MCYKQKKIDKFISLSNEYKSHTDKFKHGVETLKANQFYLNERREIHESTSLK